MEKEDEKNDMDCYPSFWNSFVVDTFVVDTLFHTFCVDTFLLTRLLLTPLLLPSTKWKPAHLAPQ